MPEYTIDHCPDVELTKLPNEKVTTYDGHLLQLGSVAYFRYTPPSAAIQYVVVSSRAIRRDGSFEVIVVGPRNFATAVNAKDLVYDVDLWWDFCKQHYAETATRRNTHGQRQKVRQPRESARPD